MDNPRRYDGDLKQPYPTEEEITGDENAPVPAGTEGDAYTPEMFREARRRTHGDYYASEALAPAGGRMPQHTLNALGSHISNMPRQEDREVGHRLITEIRRARESEETFRKHNNAKAGIIDDLIAQRDAEDAEIARLNQDGENLHAIYREKDAENAALRERAEKEREDLAEWADRFVADHNRLALRLKNAEANRDRLRETLKEIGGDSRDNSARVNCIVRAALGEKKP